MKIKKISLSEATYPDNYASWRPPKELFVFGHGSRKVSAYTSR